MKVSIIIPTRNRAKLLMERSLPSVGRQTFENFEVIIVDDASEEKYPFFYDGTKVAYYRNTERMGLAWNKNFGISKAKGEYIVFLDDDNEFHPDFLTRTVAWLDEANSADAVGVDKTIVYPEGKVHHRPKIPCSINDGFLMRRKIFDIVQYDGDLQANEDADFGIRFFKAGFIMSQIYQTLMTVYGSPIFNTTSYSDYTDHHLDGLAKFWLKHHDYKKYIGRMFLLSAGSPKWFKYLYWLGEKVKRYYQIWKS